MDKIIELGESRPLVPGKIFAEQNNLRTIERTRRCKIAWLEPGADTEWLFRDMAKYVADLNARYFGFDLFGFVDHLQYTVYEGSVSKPGHYGWHIDMGLTTAPRKLSISLSLSEPTDYRGGELQFRDLSQKKAGKEAGHIHAFPSWAAHRVTPVTTGIRRSLVGWIAGPPFR